MNTLSPQQQKDILIYGACCVDPDACYEDVILIDRTLATKRVSRGENPFPKVSIAHTVTDPIDDMKNLVKELTFNPIIPLPDPAQQRANMRYRVAMQAKSLKSKQLRKRNK